MSLVASLDLLGGRKTSAHHVEPDPRCVPVFEALLANESDRKLRLHAGKGLDRYRYSSII